MQHAKERSHLSRVLANSLDPYFILSIQISALLKQKFGSIDIPIEAGNKKSRSSILILIIFMNILLLVVYQ